VDKLAKIAREIHLGGASIGEYVSSILIRNTDLCAVISVTLFDCIHLAHKGFRIDSGRDYVVKPIFFTVSLTPLCESAVSMSYQLMGTRTGYTLNFEGEIDVLEY
jgi:hypothetical protein